MTAVDGRVGDVRGSDRCACFPTLGAVKTRRLRAFGLRVRAEAS